MNNTLLKIIFNIYAIIKRSISNWDFTTNPKDMLRLNLNEEEIQHLNYERYHYPSPIVQKRIHAIFIKATTTMSNQMIGEIVGLKYHAVSKWIHAYQQAGLEALYQFNYGTNKSKLDDHSGDILQSFTQRPPMNACEAKARIEKLTGISRSPSQVRTFMKRHDLRYIKTGHIPAKADIKKQQQWIKTSNHLQQYHLYQR